MLRINLAFFPCDAFEEPADVSWRDIKVGDKSRVYVDFAKAAKRRNPELRIIGTVWTPPAWMKVNGLEGSGRPRGQNAGVLASSYKLRKSDEISKNRVARNKYPHFVAWLAAVADYFKQEGIGLYGMSPANEPRFSQYYVSCVWTAADYATIIARLGEGLEQAGHGEILLYGPEDMTGHLYDEGTPAFVRAVMAHPRAREQLDRFATHGYTDGVQADMSQVSSARFRALIAEYDKAYWMTEGGTGGHDWPEPVTDGAGIALHHALVAGHASAFVPWQISGGGASTHNFLVDGRMTPKSRTLLHFAQAAPTDGRRIGCEPGFGAVLASAYLRDADGRLGVVLINPTGEAHTVVLDLAKLGEVARLELYRTVDGESVDAAGAVEIAGGKVRLEMPAESIASLRGTVAR
jgi:O-glycosyl hydrolase